MRKYAAKAASDWNRGKRPKERKAPRGRKGKGGDGGRGNRGFDAGAGGASASLASALNDKEEPFLRPKMRRLEKVPLEFRSVREWCTLIAHNLLAEFFAIVKEVFFSLSLSPLLKSL